VIDEGVVKLGDHAKPYRFFNVPDAAL